jgi:hypothetical protein
MNLLEALLGDIIFTPDGRMLNGDEMSLGQDMQIKKSYARCTDGGMTIRSLPASGTQLHIHEEAGGITHFKHSDGSYSQINSYDAAMADAGKSGYEAQSIAERIAKFLAPNGLGWGK